jgi:AraC family transcriptional activator FtrA
MAEEMGMSLRTFLRRFAEATGQSPGDWLADERVREAKRLLTQGNPGVEDVAAAVGFGSAHTLRHHFRQKVGISPSEYRARFLEDVG